MSELRQFLSSWREKYYNDRKCSAIVNSFDLKEWTECYPNWQPGLLASVAAKNGQHFSIQYRDFSPRRTYKDFTNLQPTTV